KPVGLMRIQADGLRGWPEYSDLKARRKAEIWLTVRSRSPTNVPPATAGQARGRQDFVMSASASLISDLEDIIQYGSYARRAEAVRRIARLFMDGSPSFNEDHVGLF